MRNSLEPIALSKYPKLKLLSYFYKIYQNQICENDCSGSALVAYFHSKKDAIKLKNSLVENIKITGV